MVRQVPRPLEAPPPIRRVQARGTYSLVNVHRHCVIVPREDLSVAVEAAVGTDVKLQTGVSRREVGKNKLTFGKSGPQALVNFKPKALQDILS